MANLRTPRNLSVGDVAIDLQKNTKKKITILFIMTNTQNVGEECVPLLLRKVHQKDRIHNICEFV